MTGAISIGVSALMIGTLLTGAITMVRTQLSPALVMPVIACIFLLLRGPDSHDIVITGFGQFGFIVVLFTAVAVPVHQIQHSGFFDLFAAHAGRYVGLLLLRSQTLGLALVVLSTLSVTTVIAAIAHNITAVFVVTPLSISICSRYRIPSRWILSGVLVASNLGGFSTAWGDTPNLIEAQVWGLNNSAFFEILPANVAILAILSLAVTWLTDRDVRKSSTPVDRIQLAMEIAGFDVMREEMDVDKRRLVIGVIALTGFITLQFLWKELEIAWGAIAIAFAVAAERREDRLASLQALDIGTYSALASLFLIAHSISQSSLGEVLRDVIAGNDGSVASIAIASYLGTLLTGAASWASVAAPLVHDVNPSHAGAWALGGGICAGSSAVLTAASAGIILWMESGRRKGFEVTFGNYLVFGLIASHAMLLFYIVYVSVIDF